MEKTNTRIDKEKKEWGMIIGVGNVDREG